MPWYFFNSLGEPAVTGSYDTVEVGSITAYAGPMSGSYGSVAQATSAPEGYLFCNGAVLQISDYPLLGAKLLATYGGNGTTTFGLPNVMNRFVRGRGTPTGTTNVVSTAVAHNHTTMTSHFHSIPTHGHSVTADGHYHTLTSHSHDISDHFHSQSFTCGGPSATVGRVIAAGSEVASAGHTHNVSGTPFPDAKAAGGGAASTDSQVINTTGADFGTPTPGTSGMSPSPLNGDSSTSISMTAALPVPVYFATGYVIRTGVI